YNCEKNVPVEIQDLLIGLINKRRDKENNDYALSNGGHPLLMEKIMGFDCYLAEEAFTHSTHENVLHDGILAELLEETLNDAVRNVDKRLIWFLVYRASKVWMQYRPDHFQGEWRTLAALEMQIQHGQMGDHVDLHVTE
ncbi:hypothetical protein OSTOST_22151, partial [Ostertagia ostertagi]